MLATFFAGVALLAALAASGCGSSTDTSTATQAVAPPTDAAIRSPEDATRALLLGLRAQLQAVARHDKTAAARHRDWVIEHVAARDSILARYKALPTRIVRDDAQVLRALVESWAACIEHYSAGLELDQVQLSATGADGRGAAVDVPARGRNDRAILRVACTRDAADQWRVVGLDFERPPATATARSPMPPGSAPAP